MLEKTLLNALAAYRIELYTGNCFHTEDEISAICKHISACQDYLSCGNRASASWMTENHYVLYKAIKCAYEMDRCEECNAEERQYLNKCILFYKSFYEKNGLDY